MNKNDFESRLDIIDIWAFTRSLPTDLNPLVKTFNAVKDINKTDYDIAYKIVCDLINRLW